MLKANKKDRLLQSAFENRHRIEKDELLEKLSQLALHRFKCVFVSVCFTEGRSFAPFLKSGTEDCCDELFLLNIDLNSQQYLNVKEVSISEVKIRFAARIPIYVENTNVGFLILTDVQPRPDFDPVKIQDLNDIVLEMTRRITEIINEYHEDEEAPEEEQEKLNSTSAMLVKLLVDIKNPMSNLSRMCYELKQVTEKLERKVSPRTLASPALSEKVEKPEELQATAERLQREITDRKNVIKANLQKGLQTINELKRTSWPRSRQPMSLQDLTSVPTDQYLPLPDYLDDIQRRIPLEEYQRKRITWEITSSASFKSSQQSMIEVSNDQSQLIAEYLNFLIILACQKWKQIKIRINMVDIPAINPSFSLNSQGTPKSIASTSSTASSSSSSSVFLGQLQISLISSSRIPGTSSIFKKNELSQLIQICDNVIENSVGIVEGKFQKQISQSNEMKQISFSCFMRKIYCYQPYSAQAEAEKRPSTAGFFPMSYFSSPRCSTASGGNKRKPSASSSTTTMSTGSDETSRGFVPIQNSASDDGFPPKTIILDQNIEERMRRLKSPSHASVSSSLNSFVTEFSRIFGSKPNKKVPTSQQISPRTSFKSNRIVPAH